VEEDIKDNTIAVSIPKLRYRLLKSVNTKLGYYQTAYLEAF